MDKFAQRFMESEPCFIMEVLLYYIENYNTITIEP